MIDPNFGLEVKRIRQDANISLREMARKLGITPAYLSRIENGHENPPKAETIGKIAEILHIEASILFALVSKDLQNKRIPDEIINGYQKNEINTKKVPEFFRSIKDADLTEDEWDKIIKDIKKRGNK